MEVFMAKKSNKNEVVVKIEGKEWKDALDKAFQERVKKVNVDGFRKGKVPRDIYEKKFGKESLYFPASDFVVESAYKKMYKCAIITVLIFYVSIFLIPRFEYYVFGSYGFAFFPVFFSIVGCIAIYLFYVFFNSQIL